MIQIEFVNDIGRIVMGADSDLRIIEIDGVGFATKTRNVASYSGIAGQNKLSETVNARTITIKGDIKSTAPQSVLTRMMKILNSTGTLKMRFGSKRRSIKADCTECDIADRNGAYQPFIIQFICDYPYFSDINSTQVHVFDIQRKLKTAFSLPCVFSTRIAEKDILNKGDVVCEPIFYITAVSVGESDGNIIIANESTAQKIVLAYKPARGEVITVDIENRTVKSSVNGDIIYSLDDDSYLSDFYLAKGSNRISITNESGGEINVLCRFSNKYIEAVY